MTDVHVSEDATQEIFVAAFQSLATLRERNRFGPWLMQIARRVAGICDKSRLEHRSRLTSLSRSHGWILWKILVHKFYWS